MEGSSAGGAVVPLAGVGWSVELLDLTALDIMPSLRTTLDRYKVPQSWSRPGEAPSPGRVLAQPVVAQRP